MGLRVRDQARVVAHQPQDVLRMPRLAQHPVALETVNLRRRLGAREDPIAEERPDRRDGHDGGDPWV